ncbi:hypothetical protein DFP93_101279 [Aneurinibacillus soli]|uniref:DNA primase small subunit n=1 Tax=Aneurinibacillus soli TaxID=1500254 RepID=A0A0U5AWV4_9BACL|nr:primase C-terminal domain-containing protein [Aneurinibacillus soli]PYE64253.1 hypothetical protein DFP93_101279 [Aneurinibacillus soli]BAU28202.1 DNA primase small subunit [Aneurinibacillus soli]
MNRNRLCDITKLGDPTGYRDAYMTYFRYPDEMAVYFQNNQRESKGGHWYPSVMGYKGPAYTDWIPIDIDATTIEEAQDGAVQAIEILEMYGIDTNACRFYFSGAKGFHIMIPATMAGLRSGDDIHKRLLYLVTNLMSGRVDIDMKIYDKVRIFRLPNTINGKSSLYKVELYEFELRNMSVEQIREMAKNPREELDVEEEYELNEYLHELNQAYEQLQKDGAQPYAGVNGDKATIRVKLCMHSIMQGIPEGSRDNAGLRVVTHLKHAGLNPKMVWVAFDEWNNGNNPPLDTDDMERIYRQGMEREYDFGCRDAVLQEHCDKRCKLWKEEYTINNVSRRW